MIRYLKFASTFKEQRSINTLKWGSCPCCHHWDRPDPPLLEKPQLKLSTEPSPQTQLV